LKNLINLIFFPVSLCLEHLHISWQSSDNFMDGLMSTVKKNAGIRHAGAVLSRKSTIPARNTAGATGAGSIGIIFANAPITAGISVIPDGAGH
jgi:hypothetical protein